jgi:amino-acid N-acetyltransferase
MTIIIRPAEAPDVPAIASLVNHYAAQNLMLPRSEAQVSLARPDFLVAIDDQGGLAGCGSLVGLTLSLAEIRSLAVAAEHHGNGLGGKIVAALLEMAQRRGLDQVCALTLRPNFFQRLGFQVVDRWSLAPKIWSECVHCPKFHRCDEIAVLMNLTEPAGKPVDIPWWRPLAQVTPLPVLRRLAPRRT